MKALLFILILFTFVKTISYAIYELKENKNKPAATTIIGVALGSCILTSTLIFFR